MSLETGKILSEGKGEVQEAVRPFVHTLCICYTFILCLFANVLLMFRVSVCCTSLAVSVVSIRSSFVNILVTFSCGFDDVLLCVACRSTFATTRWV